ncbi:MAG: hypothetical protein IOC49_13895 [Methylobacterium sp.]|nr:hypothetical protein [Methylobacterium sp.]
MPLTQLIRMLDFPAIARLEHEFISGHCPSIEQTEPDLWKRIDLHSIEIFGITYDDAASYWPPKLEHAVKKWNPVFHKKACDNNRIRA